jgi:hypothetical protein
MSRKDAITVRRRAIAVLREHLPAHAVQRRAWRVYNERAKSLPYISTPFLELSRRQNQSLWSGARTAITKCSYRLRSSFK